MPVEAIGRTGGPICDRGFESRPNFGQWLRWEAALEEIKAYYQVPDAFRALALKELGPESKA